MSYSFEAIEKQAQETHSKTARVLGAQANESFFKKNKLTIGVAVASLALVAVSFSAPSFQSFTASILNEAEFTSETTDIPDAKSQSLLDAVATMNGATESETTTTADDSSSDAAPAESDFEDTATEASDIALTPLSTDRGASVDELDAVSSALKKHDEETATIQTLGATAAAETAPEETVSQEEIPDAIKALMNKNASNNAASDSATTDTASSVTEVNPFLSLQETNSESSANTVNPVAAINTQTDEATAIDVLPFKENSHTFDSATATTEGTLTDPLETENLHGTTEIVDTATETTVTETPKVVDGVQKFTGILENTSAKSSRPFSYYLVLNDNSKLLINTQRDLRNVEGKEITIEIDGTRDEFVLNKVIYNKHQKKLAQSGPAEMLAFALVFALAGTWYFRRKTA